MKQFVKTLAAMLLIAMCLTSDSALTSTAETAQYLSNNSANCESSGQKPKSSEYQNVRVNQEMNALRRELSDLP